MILFTLVMIFFTTLKKKMCHFNTLILAWVLLVAVHFNLMVDFEVLILMVPTIKNNISNDL
jgi:hypothetical protein